VKIVLVNNTSANGHFGSGLVIDTIHKKLEERGHSVGFSIRMDWNWRRNNHLEKQRLSSADLVIVNGEGSVHDNLRPDLIEIAGKYPCVLINTVFQNEPETEYLEKFKYIAVRESFSQKEMQKHGVNSVVVPDLIFAADVERPEILHDRIAMDSIMGGRGISPRGNALDQIGKARTLCTGRFHGVCMALKWGVPFSAFPSNTHKTLGMMTDAGCSHLYFETQDEAMENIQPFDGSEYVRKAREAIGQMFDDILK
jgi:hypothetical protein